MNFHSKLADHYSKVRMRLGGGMSLIDLAQFQAPVLYLPAPVAFPNDVLDPVPDQRGVAAWNIEVIGHDAELIAARRALAAFARLRASNPHFHSMRHVQLAAAVAFKVDPEVLTGPCRRQGAVRVRQIAMTIACQVCAIGRNEIGRRFNRDHSTVHYASKKMAYLVDGATSSIGGF